METLTIVPFHVDHRQAFLDLNRAWLEELFLMEPYDLKVLSEPESMVLEGGGQIFFGLLEGQAVATFALTPRGFGTMELNKMAVHKDHRSRGFGHQLMTFVWTIAKPWASLLLSFIPTPNWAVRFICTASLALWKRRFLRIAFTNGPTSGWSSGGEWPWMGGSAIQKPGA